MSAGKHPSSDGLRKLADWLDDQDVARVGGLNVGFWLTNETPELFSEMVRATGAKIDASLTNTVFASGALFGISVGFYAAKAKVGAVRKVVREVEVEEFVIPGAA